MATDVNISSPIPLPISGHVVVDTGSIAIGNFPAIQPISGTVNVGNLPALQPVSVSNFPPIQLVDVVNAPLDVTGAVSVLNFPAVLPVTISNFPLIQPVQVTGTPLPVSGNVTIANFPPVYPMTGSMEISNFPALQAVQVSNVVQVSGAVDITDRVARSLGHVIVDSMPPLSVGGSVAVSNFPATQPVTFAAVARQSVMLSWERLAGSASESALTNFTNGTLNAVSLAAAASYTVSPGKTLRITQINVALRTTANQVVNTRVRIRQAVSVSNASPIIWQGELGTSNTANAAEIEYSQSFSPDGGIEVSAGQQITFTHLESSAAGTVSFVIAGYEY